MTATRNALPLSVLEGINDSSAQLPVYSEFDRPIHLPHMFVFSERGSTDAQFAAGDTLLSKYGARSFDPKSKFFTHQTELINSLNAEGNTMLIQRLRPPNANPPASVRLWVDMIEDNIPTYERDPVTQRYKLDNTGKRIPTGETTRGLRLRWFIEPAGSYVNRTTENGTSRATEAMTTRFLESNFGEARVRAGIMTNSDGEQSQAYPIQDMALSDFGAFGNNVGFTLYAPTSESAMEADIATMRSQGAYLFRMGFVEKDPDTAIARPIKTLFNADTVDFTYKPGAYDETTGVELHIDDTILPRYTQEPVGGRPEIRPTVGHVHVYEEYLDMLLSAIQEKEYQFGTMTNLEDERFLVNPFSGHDYNHVPYDSVEIVGPAEDGLMLTENAVHYFRGGSDGDVNLANFDNAVAYQLRYYGELEHSFLDRLAYPQSVLYDTGFSIDTKLQFLVPMGRRKDLWVGLCTQDATQPKNTSAEEASIAMMLMNRARMYPESVIHGTPVCRAILVGHSGELINHQYKKPLPLIIELATKFAREMGAGNGVMREEFGYDLRENKRITRFKNVNAPWLPVNARANNWDNGLTQVRRWDHKSLFFPAVQTVYPLDSSILNSPRNMMICVECQKVADVVWRELTGQDMSDGELIETSDRLIRENTQGRFGSKIRIEPETFLTLDDQRRNYSWSAIIHVHGPGQRNVAVTTVEAHRSA